MNSVLKRDGMALEILKWNDRHMMFKEGNKRGRKM